VERNDKSFQVFTDNPCNLTVRLFNYPAWKVKVNGRNVTVALPRLPA